MKIIDNIKTVKSFRENLTGSVGLVPTMGALHRGHASLIERSLHENDITFVSIFVNPYQFNNPDDYENYTNTLDADKALLESFGVDALFLPKSETMYPSKETFSINTSHYHMKHLEGKHRPGHFSSVLTIVLKLLNCIAPNNAYFGKKDFQQCQLIQAMAEDLFLNTTIVACPTVREASHLPYSSRNSRLSNDEKQRAEQAFQIIHDVNKKNRLDILKKLANIAIQVEYLEIIENRVFSAIKINTIRLIDNFSLGEKSTC
jgi:pantoate--beta-alanine ligase